MSEIQPQKVEMLLLEGRPSGLRYVDLKPKTIRAFITPRTSLKKLLKRREMGAAGVYILYGEVPDNPLPQIYIGETDEVKERLPDHNREKDFWTEAIVFVAQDETLDKAGVRYIESELVRRIKRDNLVDVDNDTDPSEKFLSEANIAVMNSFISDITSLLVVLGYRIVRSDNEIEPGSELVSSTESEGKPPLLWIKQDSIKARGRDTDEGFIVYEGSFAASETLSSATKGERELKQSLLEKGILQPDPENKHYRFTQDYLFTSPSYSAALVLGRSANGRTEWKTENGLTLKDLQNQ